MTDETRADAAEATLQDIIDECKSAIRFAPDRPTPTCPDIDDAILDLKEIYRQITTANETLTDNDLSSPWGPRSVGREVDVVIDMLEKLRKANEALRENGTHFHHAVRDIKQVAEAGLGVWA